MYTPGNAGWANCIILPYGSHEDEAAGLERLQRRYTDGLPADLVYGAYAFARHRLDGSVKFPDELCNVDTISLYDELLWNSGWVGGGLQFRAGNVAVRARIYGIDGKEIIPRRPFEPEHASEVAVAARKLEAACELACLNITPDLTSIQGAPEMPRIVQVQEIDW